MPPSTILRVGLTGNIAAGKSTVSCWLAELGCHLIDADELGHRCMEPGQPAHDEVIRTFGEKIVTPGGDIDRRHLGRLVFSDDAARARLEAILHPCIRHLEEEEAARWRDAVETGIVVTEAALLYEAGSAKRYHRVVVVVAPDELRLARLEAEGLTPEEARQRLQAQMDQQRKADAADYVIDNAGELAATRAQVETLSEKLHQDLAALQSGHAG
ncbi:MAG: dephospho-CoA kinase [Acidobacteriota bacterium]